LIKKIKNIAFVIITGFLLNSCASILMPSGGPKDITPPGIKESIPENYSVNFNEKKIFIKFDEFIQLKNINQSLIISPPLPEKPKIIAKGKTLMIDINNELEDSTTYTFNFGESITDITEGNAQKNFQFIFSTGNFIDSLQIEGKIINSFDLLEEENALIMLYNNYEDSIPYKEQPLYLAKTNANGNFVLNNIKTGTYKMFALKDMNNNYLFDQPNEQVAFLDSLITPKAELLLKIDTIIADTNAIDTTAIDSIVNTSTTIYSPKDIIMYLFEEDNSEQYISNSDRKMKGKCVFNFNKTLKDTFIIKPINFDIPDKELLIEKNLTNDTIICWISDTSICNLDTLCFSVSYFKKDSNEISFLNTDTINLRYRQVKKVRKKDIEIQDTTLKFKTSIVSGNKIDINKDILIDFETPLNNIDTSLILLSEIIDSVKTPVEFKFFRDSFSLRKYHINYKWEQEKIYNFSIVPNAFTDIFNKTNDSLNFDFNIEQEEHYGSIILNITNIQEAIIIQLMNANQKVIHELFIEQNKKIKIPYLHPGKYELKIIFDKNKNKKWDTGKYLKNIQPEKVLFYQEEIDIRGNWDLDVEIDLLKK